MAVTTAIRNITEPPLLPVLYCSYETNDDPVHRVACHNLKLLTRLELRGTYFGGGWAERRNKCGAGIRRHGVQSDTNGRVTGSKFLPYPDLKPGEKGHATFPIGSAATIVLVGEWKGHWRSSY